MSERVTLYRALQALAARVPRINPDVRLRNRRLCRAAATFRPDVVVLTGDNTVILPETLAALKEDHGSALIYASGTSPVVFSHAVERAAAPLYDLVVTNDLHHAIQWRELGAPRTEVLPLGAVDPDWHRPYDLEPEERARLACDVGFVGTLVPALLYGERIAALEALRDLDLAIWSVHEVPASLRRFHRGPALGLDMLRAMRAAAIALNPHANFMRSGGNLRLFELCGIGAFQVADDRPGIRAWLTPGVHLETYRDPDHLRGIVGRYLGDPEARRRLAEAGHRHVHARHTYDQRMARLLELLADARTAARPRQS
jgi:spore maturation protein CgeB